MVVSPLEICTLCAIGDEFLRELESDPEFDRIITPRRKGEECEVEPDRQADQEAEPA